MSRPFSFKRFTIVQDHSAMKVGTDGVLLGAWSRIERSDRYMLDIGSGTGVIALMLAQRSEASGAFIDAVEIDQASALEAEFNVRQSPWATRVRVFHGSVQETVDILHSSYDLIVSNPPFFVDSLHAPDRARTTARHAVTLSCPDLMSISSRMLSEHGRLCVIIPCDQEYLYKSAAADYGMKLSRIAHVYPKGGMPAKRSMLEFSRDSLSVSVFHMEDIIIEMPDGQTYSPEYVSMMSEFYLKF